MKIFDWLGDMFSPGSSAHLDPYHSDEPGPSAPPPSPPAYDFQAATEKLEALREGRKNVVYADTQGHLTGGIGHLILPRDNMQLDDEISDAQIDAWFAIDSAGALHAALLQMQEAGITDQHFIPYLTSVCFQMGTAWTAKFPSTWKMIVTGQYERAALALNGTQWAEQTPVRVQDFQGALRRLPAKVTT